jgi:hypothetical protein
LSDVSSPFIPAASRRRRRFDPSSGKVFISASTALFVPEKIFQFAHEKKQLVEALKHLSSLLFSAAGGKREEEFKREQKAMNDPLLINFSAFLCLTLAPGRNQLRRKKGELKAFLAARPLSKTNFSHYVINESQAHSRDDKV